MTLPCPGITVPGIPTLDGYRDPLPDEHGRFMRFCPACKEGWNHQFFEGPVHKEDPRCEALRANFAAWKKDERRKRGANLRAVWSVQFIVPIEAPGGELRIVHVAPPTGTRGPFQYTLGWAFSQGGGIGEDFDYRVLVKDEIPDRCCFANAAGHEFSVPASICVFTYGWTGDDAEWLPPGKRPGQPGEP